METRMNEIDPNIAARQRWMGVLARAGSALDSHEAALKDSAYQLIRSPEVGMTWCAGAWAAPVAPSTSAK